MSGPNLVVERRLAMIPTLDDVILRCLSSRHSADDLYSLLCFIVVSCIDVALFSSTTTLTL